MASESSSSFSSSSGDDFFPHLLDSRSNEITPYDKEPEYNTVEEADAAAAEDQSDEDEIEPDLDLWPPASRVGNTDWCQCGKCVARDRRQDCVCCFDYDECVEKIRSASEQCITAVADFATVCTHPEVLLTALRGFLDLTKRSLNASAGNE